MVSPEVAAALSHVTLRTVYRTVEAGQTHYTETPAGELRICLKSFERQISTPDRIHESEQ